MKTSWPDSRPVFVLRSTVMPSGPWLDQVGILPARIDPVWMGRIVPFLAVAENGQDRPRMLLFQLVVLRSELAFDLLQCFLLGLCPAALQFLSQLAHPRDLAGHHQVGAQDGEFRDRFRGQLLLGRDTDV